MSIPVEITPLAAARRAAELSPDDPHIQAQLGYLLIATGQLDDAETQFRRTIEAAPDIGGFHAALSSVLARLDRPEAAIIAARRAAELSPDDPHIQAQLAYLLIATSQLDDAEAQFRRAIEAAPDIGGFHAALSNVLARLDRPEAAIIAARRAAELSPDDPHIQAQLGYLLIATSQLDDAEAQFRQAIEIAPDICGFHAALSNVLARLGRAGVTIAATRRTAELSPDDPHIQAQLGYLLIATSQLDDAEAQFRRAIEIAPDIGGFHAALSNVLARLDRPEAAIIAARRAAELSPDDPHIQSQLVHRLAAAGQLDDAEAQFRRAIEIPPDIGSFLLAFSNALARLRRSETATAAAQQAAELSPDDAHIQAQVGDPLAAAGQRDDAEAHSRLAIEVPPKQTTPSDAPASSLAWQDRVRFLLATEPTVDVPTLPLMPQRSKDIINCRVPRSVRWALTATALLLVFISLFDAPATLLGDVTGHSRTDVSSSEFPIGIRIDRPQPPIRTRVPDARQRADSSAQPAVVPALLLSEATAAAENPPNIGSVSASAESNEKESQSQRNTIVNSQKNQRTQIERALPTELTTALSSKTRVSDQAQHVVAENNSEGGQPRPLGEELTAGMLRRADLPTTAAVPDVAAPRPTEAASSESQPAISLPGMQVEHGEIANHSRQSDRIPQFGIPEIGALPTQQSEQSGTELASQSAETGYRVERFRSTTVETNGRAWLRIGS